MVRLLLAAACTVLVAACPDDRPRETAPAPAPAELVAPRPRDPCVRDQDCALLPYVTCCGECPPAPPFEVGTREALDAIFIESEQRCAEDRRPCTPPVCERPPRGCYARAACQAGVCVVQAEGCRP